MISLLVSVLLAILVVLSVLYWYQLEKNDENHQQQEDERIQPLLRGLNFMLADEPDLALQEVVKVARLRSETTEVYMFLGEMFRSRGEFGRAVRIHQNILARPNVDPELYVQAQFALATDFHKGGLIDRAIRHYHKVLQVRSDHLPSLQGLLSIHEQSHEWQQAIDLLQRISRLSQQSASLHHAYLLAAMAEEALQAQQMEQARAWQSEALRRDSCCVHAHLLNIRLCEQQQELAAALESMAKQLPEWLFLLLPELADKQKGFFLEQWRLTRQSELALSWLELCAEHQGLAAAKQLREQLAWQPSNLGEALRLTAIFGPDEPLQQYAQTWRQSLKRFSCQYCGVRIAELRWQCPQCMRWGCMGLHTLTAQTVD